MGWWGGWWVMGCYNQSKISLESNHAYKCQSPIKLLLSEQGVRHVHNHWVRKRHKGRVEKWKLSSFLQPPRVNNFVKTLSLATISIAFLKFMCKNWNGSSPSNSTENSFCCLFYIQIRTKLEIPNFSIRDRERLLSISPDNYFILVIQNVCITFRILSTAMVLSSKIDHIYVRISSKYKHNSKLEMEQ